MNRSSRVAIARETMAILASGRYRTPGGREVDLAGELGKAVGRTRLYAPGDLPRDPGPPAGLDRPGSTVEVTGETTLEAARRLAVGVGPGHSACTSRRPGTRGRVPQRGFAEQVGHGGPWSDAFRHVVFAVFDPGRDQTCLSAFHEAITDRSVGYGPTPGEG